MSLVELPDELFLKTLGCILHTWQDSVRWGDIEDSISSSQCIAINGNHAIEGLAYTCKRLFKICLPLLSESLIMSAGREKLRGCIMRHDSCGVLPGLLPTLHRKPDLAKNVK